MTYEYYYNDPFTNQSLVDHVFRFEDIYKKNATCKPFFDEFCKVGIKLELSHKLPHENDSLDRALLGFKEYLDYISKHRAYEMYTDHGKELVRSFFEKDLEKYNYRFPVRLTTH